MSDTQLSRALHALKYDAAEHAVDCCIEDSAVVQDEVRHYSNEGILLKIDLAGGVAVTLPGGVLVKLTPQLVKERLVDPGAANGRPWNSNTAGGAVQLGFRWLKEVLTAHPDWPVWFAPQYTHSNSTCPDGSSSSSILSSGSSAAIIELDCARGVNDPQKKPSAPRVRGGTGGLDTAEYIWWMIMRCAARGSLGRACAGERYDEPGVLSVRFFKSCQHDAAAGSYGRLEGSRRAAVASMLQGRNTRDVHDALLVERPAEHKLDGNLSACGASCAVLRKVKNEPAQRAVRAAQGIADDFAAAAALRDQLLKEHQQKLQDPDLQKQVIAWGFLHCMHAAPNAQYVIGGWLQWQPRAYAQLCAAQQLGGWYIDSTGNEVRPAHGTGDQVLVTRVLSPHPIAAAQPYLKGDQVPGPIEWFFLAHTLRTAAYIQSGVTDFLRMVASSRADARPVDARPVHSKYLPPFIVTDHDAALIDGLSVTVNMCKATVYRKVLYGLLCAYTDAVTCMMLLHAAGESDPATQERFSNPMRLSHHEMSAVVDATAALCSEGAGVEPDIWFLHGQLLADLAGLTSAADVPLLAGKTPAAQLSVVLSELAAELAAVQDTMTPCSSNTAAASHPAAVPTDLNRALAAYAAAAQKLQSLILEFVHLQLCAWHWIKACKDYGLYGKPFAHMSIADRKFVSWLLGVILGMPAKQTRFRGLHRVTAGVMYLQAVIRICRTPYLSAHPTQHVPQLDGWVVARPATDADCKRGSSRGRPVYVVEYPYFLTASLKHVQVRVYADRVVEADCESEDAPDSDGSGGVCLGADASSSSSNSSHDSVNSSTPQQLGFVRVLNPVGFEGIASYAESILQNDTHVSAWGYTRPLHPQTDNLFANTDSIHKPSYACTNETNGRSEAARKDAKNSRGSRGPQQLVSFLREQRAAYEGDGERYHVNKQRLPALLTSHQRADSVRQREAEWLASPEATLCVSPGPALATSVALTADADSCLLPAAQVLWDALLAELLAGLWQSAESSALQAAASASADLLPALPAAAIHHGTSASGDVAAVHARTAAGDSSAGGSFVAKSAVQAPAASERAPGAASETATAAAESAMTDAAGAMNSSAAVGEGGCVVVCALTGGMDSASLNADSVCTSALLRPMTPPGTNTTAWLPGSLQDTDNTPESVIPEEQSEWGRRKPSRGARNVSSMSDAAGVVDAPAVGGGVAAPGAVRTSGQEPLAVARPRRAAAAEGVRRAVQCEKENNSPSSKGRTAGSRRSRDVQSIQVQLTTGQTVLVALDDNIVVRTINNNPFTFTVSPNNPKLRVNILQLTRIEVEGKGARARVFGYGRYYRSDSRSLSSKLVQEQVADGRLSLQGHAVAVFGKRTLCQLSKPQVAAVSSKAAYGY